MKKKIKDWETEAERKAIEFQNDCIKSVAEDINNELEGTSYGLEDFNIDDYVNHYIEDKCIYYSECEKIIKDLDYDIWTDDWHFGQRANNLTEAGYYALYGALYDVDIEQKIIDKLNTSGNE